MFDIPLSFLFPFFILDGSEVEVKAKKGENLLRIAHENGIDLEGACECSLACSTCHVILPEGLFTRGEKNEKRKREQALKKERNQRYFIFLTPLSRNIRSTRRTRRRRI